MNIIFIYGSLREKSSNRALAHTAARMAPEDMRIELVGPEGLPLYDQDLEGSSFPEAATALKERIASADGVVFVTPEFNRSIPGPLKNLIDWSSRPDGKHPWGGKPVGVMGVSSGPRGAVVAQYDLKRILTYLGANLMGQPEFYVDNSDKKIDDDGVLRHEKTKEYLKRYLEAFGKHVSS
jgi:chromate reductase